MLITNLTGKLLDYEVGTELVEKCLSSNHRFFLTLSMEMRMNVFCHKRNGEVPFYIHNQDLLLLDLIKQIPIFLVTKQQCLKTFAVGYFGHTDNVTVPIDVLPHTVPDSFSEAIDERDLRCPNIFDQDHLSDNKMTASIDLWGLYTREYPSGKSYSIEESHPRIFIWVDKIKDFVKDDRHNYLLLTTQVILHELSHAIMDINLTGDDSRQSCHNKFGLYFYMLKEESLANALSMTLMKNYINNKDWDFLVSVVKQQPFEYALGLEYLQDDEYFVEDSVETWMHLKECSSLSKKVVREWMKYVYENRHLERNQIELLDKNIGDSRDLFRYPSSKGKFYDNHNVAVQVIKDYVEEHPFITRAELHVKFPTFINKHYEPIIDYPGKNGFQNKKPQMNARSVDDDKIVDCMDGKVAICDYWHPDSMNDFVANAAKLGIKIETFY